jgi:tRNA(adenine34) deaminase
MPGCSPRELKPAARGLLLQCLGDADPTNASLVEPRFFNLKERYVMAKTKRRISKPSSAKSSDKKGSDQRWSATVETVSTYPPKDLYTKDAATIARVMATKKVSPKGLGSAIRMVQFYINRAGKNLSATRKRELEKAKTLLQKRAAAKTTRRRPK